MRYSKTLLVLAGCMLTACTGPIIMGTDAGIIAVTKPSTPPPADTEDQIPQHESWCYQTLGDTECYAHPQDVPPNRLVNVDPASRYPVDLPAYKNALNQSSAAVVVTPAATVIVPATPGTTTVVTPATPIITPVTTQTVPPAPQPVVSTPSKKSAKAKKKHKPSTAAPTPAAPATPTPQANGPVSLTPSPDQTEQKNLPNELQGEPASPASNP